MHTFVFMLMSRRRRRRRYCSMYYYIILHYRIVYQIVLQHAVLFSSELYYSYIIVILYLECLYYAYIYIYIYIIYVYMYVYMSLSLYIYIYIYVLREYRGRRSGPVEGAVLDVALKVVLAIICITLLLSFQFMRMFNYSVYTFRILR